MKRISKNKACYAMSGDNKPVLHVVPGEAFCVETEDCYSGNLRTPQDRFTKEMWNTVNPATGPVYVDGAVPGDILRVDIERIKTRNYAVMCVEKGSGALGKQIEGVETKIIPIRAGNLLVDKNLAIPVKPMIGVIGTAPKQRAVLNGTPGEHGGNMDCKEITAGASVYLPVSVNGGLLAVGDIHALMGDGEVCICGAEVCGEIVMRTWLVRFPIPTPCVETADDVSFIGSARSLDKCERMVLSKTHKFLTSSLNLKANQAAMLMSLAGDLNVCQVVDPLKTMRFTLPKFVLRAFGMGYRPAKRVAVKNHKAEMPGGKRR